MSMVPDPAAGSSGDRPATGTPAYGTPSVPYGSPLVYVGVQDRLDGTDLRPQVWDEVRTRSLLMAFDGRVLEIFGDLRLGPSAGVFGTVGPSGNPSVHESLRFHVGRLRFMVDGPDREGRRTLVLRILDEYSMSFTVEVMTKTKMGSYNSRLPRFEADEWAVVGPFLSRVAAACQRWG